MFAGCLLIDFIFCLIVYIESLSLQFLFGMFACCNVIWITFLFIYWYYYIEAPNDSAATSTPITSWNNRLYRDDNDKRLLIHLLTHSCLLTHDYSLTHSLIDLCRLPVTIITGFLGK